MVFVARGGFVSWSLRSSLYLTFFFIRAAHGGVAVGERDNILFTAPEPVGLVSKYELRWRGAKRRAVVC